jgi:[NiFe] hydrogenase maturation protein HypF
MTEANKAEGTRKKPAPASGQHAGKTRGSAQADSDPVVHVHVHVTGIVQGVGYRPFVWKLATARDITGWVRNASDGVHIDAKGHQSSIDSFVLALSTQAPDAARVDTVHVDKLSSDHISPMASENGAHVKVSAARADSDFRIVESEETSELSTLVSPDIATCPACASELFDPNNRRYHYPFINCTNCGPRFTIIDALPYDRANTSMASFEMCDDCASEYEDPSDRRFHAQPNACFDCGPQLSWRTVENPGRVVWGKDRETSDRIIAAAAAMIINGGIVAVKGLGGYHLACDATNQKAVERLRERKMRPTKPLAVMFPQLDQVRRLCHVNATERELLCGSQRPIVLLRRRAAEELDTADVPFDVCSSIAGPLPQLGVMLPYTPVQRLLIDAVGKPLVMTSGNISEEPIIADDQIAVARLIGVADAFLGNNRPIRARYDDSVVSVVEGSEMVIRRARGIAPTPLLLPKADTGDAEVLACGPEQKATFCITRKEQAFVSQHIGDLENSDAFDSWKESLGQYERLFGLTWNVLACDMHPEYLSSKWAHEQAEKRGIALTEVQHHHAHIASVLAEHGVRDRVVGIALDGTGYGPDGAIWGGEILACDMASYNRAAHLSYFRLPGGAAAIRKPLRCALGLLDTCGLGDSPVAADITSRLGIEGPVVRQMLLRDLNSPLTSSAGRLFDAVAAMLGLVDKAGYDGEPACLLEAAATLVDGVDSDPEVSQRYRVELKPGDGEHDDSFLIDTTPLVQAVVDDIVAGTDVRVIARRFHEGFCDGISHAAVAVARSSELDAVALSGGVFMNRIVLEGVRARLKSAGLRVLVPHDIPVNDACISYGQAAVARARIAAGDLKVSQ